MKKEKVRRELRNDGQLNGWIDNISSMSYLKNAFDNLMEGCQIIGYDLRYLYLNHAAVMQSGKPYQELIGKNITEIWPGIEKTELFQQINMCFQDGKPRNFQNRFNFSGGFSGWFDIKIQPVPDGVFILSMDINEKKKAEERSEAEHNLLLSLINSVSDTIIFSLDRKYCYTAFNELHRREMKLVWNVDIETGMNLLSCMTIPELRESAQKSMDRALNGEAFTEIQVQPEPRTIYEFSWSPIFQKEQVTGLTVLIRNITEKKQTEEDLVAAKELAEKNEKLKSDLLKKLNDAQHTAKIGSWEWHIGPDEVWWSNELYRIFELDPKEYIPSAEKNAAFVHPDDIEPYHNEVARVITEKGELDFDLRIISGKGRLKYCNSCARLIFDENGNPVRMFGTFADITQRKLAEEALKQSEYRFRKIYENGPLGLTMSNNEYRFIMANPKFCEITGYSEEELKNLTYRDITYKDDIEKGHLEVKKLFNKEIPLFKIEKRYMRKDGRIIWVSLTVTSYFDNNDKKMYSLAMIEDITERKVYHDEIIRLNETLEQRVQERTNQLSDANKDLEAFSYSVSHDLRAPLRGINGFTKILLEDYAGNLDSEGRRICNVIQDNATRMGKLIDDLLAFSRLGRAEIQMTNIPMNKMVNSVYHELTDENSRSRINLILHELGNARADATLLRQVWTNLLSNAVKYSSKCEKAIIEVNHSIQNNQHIYCIKDNGVGFDMSYASKLFGVFQRLHTTRQFEGTGVGLAIVHRIVTRHGGLIWAIGEVEKGASFYFSLPAEI